MSGVKPCAKGCEQISKVCIDEESLGIEVKPLGSTLRAKSLNIDPKPNTAQDYVFKTHSHSQRFSKIQKLPKANKMEHLYNTYLYLSYAQRLPTLPAPSPLDLPKRCNGEKTLVLDLDETLVHCVSGTLSNAVHLTMDTPNSQRVPISMFVRPYAQELLKAASLEFEVVVFTASHQFYADKVLDYLDPEGELIHHRLYRHHCTSVEGFNVKDLRVLGRDLSKVVIVDNCAISFAYQLENGVPILSWYSDIEDRELQKLMIYLKMAQKAEDVRKLNRKTFNLRSFCSEYEKASYSSDKENYKPK